MVDSKLNHNTNIERNHEWHISGNPEKYKHRMNSKNTKTKVGSRVLVTATGEVKWNMKLSCKSSVGWDITLARVSTSLPASFYDLTRNSRARKWGKKGKAVERREDRASCCNAIGKPYNSGDTNAFNNFGRSAIRSGGRRGSERGWLCRDEKRRGALWDMAEGLFTFWAWG